MDPVCLDDNPIQFVEVLKTLSSKVKLSAFKKHTRGPKKPAVKRNVSKNAPHVSTAKLLADRKKSNKYYLERAGLLGSMIRSNGIIEGF